MQRSNSRVVCNSDTAVPRGILSRLLPIRFLSVFTLIAICCGSVTFGQIKHNPEDEDIERVARAAVAWLELNIDSMGGDERILSALVVNEVSKRYDRMIARDNPLVVSGVNTVLAGGSTSGSAASTYIPALSIILLCDVNDQEYAEQIRGLLNHLTEIQRPNGSYNYRGRSETVGDISQAQYVGLAYFVAKHHGFDVNMESARALLDWVVLSQNNGTWYYQSQNGQLSRELKGQETQLTLSRHCSGLGTVYMIADTLQLSPRTKAMNSRGGQNMGLPPSVSIYVAPVEEGVEVKEGPLVQFNGGQLAQCKRLGNVWLDREFRPDSGSWNNYYLYALERYAFFRELEDGTVKEIPDWYDQGVDLLFTERQADGSFAMTGDEIALSPVINTCLATLFLVRSSEVLILPSNSGALGGAVGFPQDQKLQTVGGHLTGTQAVKGIEDAVTLLGKDTTDEEKQMIIESMKDSIGDFTRELEAGGQKTAFLTGLIKDRDYFRRLIAVQILASEQEMDNAIPLIYALGDPNLDIRYAAHNGLRLISRKIDTIEVPGVYNMNDFDRVKKLWTQWLLDIRPDAKLIE